MWCAQKKGAEAQCFVRVCLKNQLPLKAAKHDPAACTNILVGFTVAGDRPRARTHASVSFSLAALTRASACARVYTHTHTHTHTDVYSQHPTVYGEI